MMFVIIAILSMTASASPDAGVGQVSTSPSLELNHQGLNLGSESGSNDLGTSSAVPSADLIAPLSGTSTAAAMEAQLMNLLLGKTAFGATPMGGSVKKIHNILTKEMKPKVLDAHKSDQNELNKLMRELKKCFSVRNKALKSAAPWNTKYKFVSRHHKTCRSDEAVKYSSKEACLKEQRALYEVKKLKCNYYAEISKRFGSTFNNKAIVTKAGSEAVLSYITRISGTICGNHVHGERGRKSLAGGWGGGLLHGMLDQYLKARFACQVATKNYNDKVKDCKNKIHQYNVRKGKCNQFQTLMDTQSCKHAVLVKDTCEQYAGCYTNKLKAFQIARSTVIMNERDRKAEWRGLTRIACLIAAFADGKVSDKEVDDCKKRVVTTDHLIIRYPKVPKRTKCVVTKLYPATGAYKRKEFAPLPTLAKGKVSSPCSGVEEIPTTPRKGSPTTCKCRRVTLEGHYRAGPLVKCTGCHDVRRSKDKNSCPLGTKIFAPSTRSDWQTFLSSAGPLAHPDWIIDITRPQNGCGGCTSNAMNSLNSNQKSWRTTDGSPWWLRSTKYSNPSGDYSANCFLSLGKSKPSNENKITFNDKGCNYHSKAYYCQKKRIWVKPKSGSPKSCKCQPVTLASKYSTKLLVKCEQCLSVSKSLQKNSCPNGMKLFSPRSRADWKTFIVSAAPLRAPNWIIDITRPQNSCGGCTKYAMNSRVPQQATWRTSDKSPWWLRGTKYNQPSGDYRANCYMDLFRRPTSENSVQFRGAAPLKDGQYAHKGCSYHSRSYYCQPKYVKPKPKPKPKPLEPVSRLVPYSKLARGLQEEVFYFTQGKKLAALARRSSNVLRAGSDKIGSKQVNYPGTSSWKGLARSKDFAVRFSGYIKIGRGGKYGFALSSDDGSALYFDNKQRINNDGLHGMKTKQVTFKKVIKGQHLVRIEYFQKGGNAGCIFKYKRGNQKTWKPFRQGWDDLYMLHFKQNGLKEEIFYGSKSSKVPNLNAKKANVIRAVPRVAYSNTGAKWRGFTAKDNFAVRWSGSLTFRSKGTYRFQIASDDGSNLYLNDVIGWPLGRIRHGDTGTGKLIDNDGAHGMRKKEATAKIRSSSVPIILTYFEAGGHAGMLFKYMGKDSNMRMTIVPSRALGLTLSTTPLTPAETLPFVLVGRGRCGHGGKGMKWGTYKYWAKHQDTYASCRKKCLASPSCKSFSVRPEGGAATGFCDIRPKVADSLSDGNKAFFCWSKAG